MSFFSELKRRNIFKVAIAYTVASWLILQIVDLVLENFNTPDWIMQIFMLGLAVGFPVAIIIAWVFEVTPNGVMLQKHVDQSQSINQRTGRQLNRGIVMILAMAIVLLLTDRFRDELFGKPDNDAPVIENSEDSAVEPSASNTEKTSAVLPFHDMSAAQNQILAEYQDTPPNGGLL